ncbi:phage holin family protein [Schaalia vaccimaxillae]|uniref:phage holin family protein n=1 Tax=Schaalia vaccimaxillae TaxID=183916 RepID=UPI0003B77D88|nr:phage holin family protein [Schaalia vaccimaxillae]
MDFIARLVATMSGLWVAALLVPSISIPEGTDIGTTILTLAIIALIFTVVNSLIKPIVKTLTFTLYILTFGLFAIVTNALMFMLTGWFSVQLGFPFQTGGFWSCILGGLITAVIAALVSAAIAPKKRQNS